MSMNLHVCAKLAAETKLGKKIITEGFDLWQTPTSITRKCLSSSSPENTYREWIFTLRKVFSHPIYAAGDTFGEGPIVGYREFCPEDSHLEALNKWLEEHAGWDIEWYEM